MNAYLIVPLLAAVLGTAFGCAILTMSFRSAANRVGGLLLLGLGWWAGCEVLWNTAPDADVARTLHRVSTPGWVFLGPLSVHFLQCARDRAVPQLAAALPVLYGVSAAFGALGLASPWLIERMEAQTWGFASVPGPAFPLWMGFTVVVVGVGGLLTWRTRDDAMARIDRRHRTLVALLLWPAALVGTLTEGVLPCLGFQPPRLGSLSAAIAGGLLCWWMHRYGYARASPLAFSRRILETLPDGVALTDVDGRVRTLNEKMGELLGCRTSAAEGLPLAERLEPLLNEVLELREAETALVPLAGEKIPVAVSSAPMRDNAGARMGQVWIVRDLREVATLRARLVTSGRMAAVGELAAGIAHELNNPLAFVRANLASLKREWETACKAENSPAAPADPLLAGLEDWDELIGDTIEGVDRAAAIVRDVREFSHTGGETSEAADVEDLLDQALRLGRSQVPPGVEIQRAYQGDLPAIECAPQRLKQVFLNLLMNAAQAVGDEGWIRIQTSAERQGVLISILDAGPGIAPELTERIFDPFFTTKSVGDGTGLGLSISYEIIRRHGGEIWVESEPGEGACFHIWLPCRRSVAALALGADALP